MRMSRCWLFVALLPLVACEPAFDVAQPDRVEPRSVDGWSRYGGPGGRQFASADQIDAGNVAELALAWVYRTGDVGTVFQAMPIVHDGRLLMCTPRNRLIALDPLTGGELWRFDAQIDPGMRPANQFNCRAPAVWSAPGSNGDACASRVLMATNDARLIALDARTGARCQDFGDNGEVDLAVGVGDRLWSGEYQVTSPPAVAGDLAIVGSAVSDGQRLDAPSGVVRAYSVRTGGLAWAFDLAPPDYDYENLPVSAHGYALGTPNVWAPMSVDAERDLVFLPTGNPAPDYARPPGIDMAHYGSSVVALRASTGEVVWHFNTVHRDFWDFDVPAQPALIDLSVDGRRVPAVVQATKMGHLFVLHRETGVPLIKVTEQPVSRDGPLRDRMAPTQPFPPPAFRLSRTYEPGTSMLGLCDELDAQSVSGPVFTPISESWTIGLPSNMGAINWGGVAIDEARGLLAVNLNHLPFRTKLIARVDAQPFIDVIEDPSRTEAERVAAMSAAAERFAPPPGVEIADQLGTDYLMARYPYVDPTLGIPCAGRPMAEMVVLDLSAGQQVWRRPHGTVRDVAGLPLNWGAPGTGGPLLTAGGLIFIGAASERAFRAYDVETGVELWQHRLPRFANATPMSYVVNASGVAKQFVVVAAGGDRRSGLGEQGDFLIAFALP
ncbi:MAG: PQQ-binding-like beta-propeller repeat protein [Pseudomonadota bacterium]